MDVEKVIELQKEEIERVRRGKAVERERSSMLKKWMEKDIIKVITGPRRAGKSFLAMMSMPRSGYAYANFDDEILIREDMGRIMSALKSVYGEFDTVLFDEIQNRENWELAINSLQRQGYNIIITGSNSKLLSSELATHLTGRYVEIELFPFSYREYLYATGKKAGMESVMDYLVRGGFPEVVVKGYDSVPYLSMLFESVVMKDIVRRYRIRIHHKLLRLYEIVSAQFSSLMSAKSLRREIDISFPTLMKFLRYLSEAYLAIFSRKFSFKPKEYTRMRTFKSYMIDTGFSPSRNVGRRMENAVAVEIRRRGKGLFFHKDRQEIDFVVDGDGMLLVQVSFSSSHDSTREREIRALAAASIGKRSVSRIVVTMDYEDSIIVNRRGKRIEIEFVPIWKFLLDESW